MCVAKSMTNEWPQVHLRLLDSHFLCLADAVPLVGDMSCNVVSNMG